MLIIISPIITVLGLKMLKCVSQNMWGERHKDCSYMPNDRGASYGINLMPIVEVDSDNPAFLLKSNLCLPSYIFIFIPCVLADQHDVGTRHINALTTLSFNVRLIVRVNFVLELAINEIEIDMLMCLPCTHNPKAANVRTTKPNACSWKCHASPRRNSLKKIILQLLN